MRRGSLLIALLASRVALGSADLFNLGDGHSGALDVPAATAVTVNQYSFLAMVNSPTSITISTSMVPVPYVPAMGDLVMLWQPAGYTPVPASGDQTPISLASNATGLWELARVSAVAGSTLTLSAPLLNSAQFQANATQVVKIPEYTSVTIQSGGSIVPQAFTCPGAQPCSGGLVAFLVAGSVDTGANGAITASARGFTGGAAGSGNSLGTGCTALDLAYPNGGHKGLGIAAITTGGAGNVANGAGGGDCAQSGGGGGGNAGLGGAGGIVTDGLSVGGYGGAPLVFSLLDHLTLGGGGGSGNRTNNAASSGGSGGGAIFVRAQSILGTGVIAANGAVPAAGGDDGQGGGGAGGSVYVRLTGASSLCTRFTLQALGGDGGSTTASNKVGPGGGGGGGRVLIQTTTPGCQAGIAGGVAGNATGISNAATAGADGTQETAPAGGYLCPSDTAGPTVTAPAATVVTQTLCS